MKNTKASSQKAPSGNPARKTKKVAVEASPDITIIHIPVRQISFNPKNHRQLYSETALQEFAGELALHGIISPVTVRTVKGKYELVVGERRLRAALLAGLPTVPAIKKEYNDAEVNEIQLAENLQREDPHPLHIAHAVKIMKDDGQSIDEIAARLGKPPSFVYTRLKLLNLIENFQEVFLAGKLTTNDAFQIASLSGEAQEHFFGEAFDDWRTNPLFPVKNLEAQLKRYRCNLNQTTFDTEDNTLVPDAGACSNCIFNSAYLQSLFPDLSKERHCTNSSCFSQKTDVGFLRKIRTAVEEHQPAFFIVRRYTSDRITDMLSGFPDVTSVMWDDISTLEEPEIPNREDYTGFDEDDYDEDGEFEPESGDEQYERAMEAYRQSQREFMEEVEGGEYQKGLSVVENEVQLCYFTFDKKMTPQGKQTAKAVQDAIKNKTVTPEMLESEVERIEEREIRAKQLDVKKVRTVIYEKYTQRVSEQGTDVQVMPEDTLNVRLLVYQNLDYQSRQVIDELLESKMKGVETNPEAYLYMALGRLSDAEFCYVTRLALSCSMKGQFLQGSSAHFIWNAAVASGVDVTFVERSQREVAEDRAERIATRKHELNRMAEKIKRRRNAQ